MKEKIMQLFLLSFFFGVSAQTTYDGQVGINTDKPEAELDVNGDILVTSILKDERKSEAGENSFFLVRSLDTEPKGKVKLLKASERNVSPVNQYKIILENVDGSKVSGLNTDLKTSDYVVSVVGAVFSGALSSTVVKPVKNPNRPGNTDRDFFGTYSVEVLGGVEQDYNKLNIDFTGGTTENKKNGTWILDLLVFEKALVKDYGIVHGKVSFERNRGKVIKGSTPKGASDGTPPHFSKLKNTK